MPSGSCGSSASTPSSSRRPPKPATSAVQAPGQRRHVQAVFGVVVQVAQVDQRGLVGVVVGELEMADLRAHHRLGARRQRRVPGRAPLVVVDVAGHLLGRERVAAPVHRQHQVGLLDDLRRIQPNVGLVQQQRILACSRSKFHSRSVVKPSHCSCTPSSSSYGMCAASAASRQAAVSSVVTPSCAGSSGWRSHASAAIRRLCAAIRLVKTLSRTMAVYSSGPVTPSRCQTPWRSWCPSDSHSRAVSTSTARPHSASSESSPVTTR